VGENMSGGVYYKRYIRRETYEDLEFLASLMGFKGVSEVADFLIMYYLQDATRRGKTNERYLHEYRENMMRKRHGEI
jgi:hypothetical protein